jgi:hypothetical protein
MLQMPAHVTHQEVVVALGCGAELAEMNSADIMVFLFFFRGLCSHFQQQHCSYCSKESISLCCTASPLSMGA